MNDSNYYAIKHIGGFRGRIVHNSVATPANNIVSTVIYEADDAEFAYVKHTTVIPTNRAGTPIPQIEGWYEYVQVYMECPKGDVTFKDQDETNR